MSVQGQPAGRRTIYLMRHGDSRIDTVHRFVGCVNHPLNDTGRAQAEWWRDELSTLEFSAVYCSDLERSKQTADIIGRDWATEPCVMAELAEIDLGDWDGMPIDDVRRQYPVEFAARGADFTGYRPPSGESFADLAERVLPAFRRIADSAQGNVLVVGHAGVNRVIMCDLLGMPIGNIFRLRQDYGCLNVLESAGTGWVVRRVNIPAGTERQRVQSVPGPDVGLSL